MIRVFVLYSQAPDPEQYERHVEFAAREASGATVRHGRILGSPAGKADAEYYFEYEFPDRDAWKAAQQGLVNGAEDAQKLGVPFKVYFAELD